MNKPQITTPNRPKPYLIDAYNGYYGNLRNFYAIIVRFWENRSPMYNNASLLCSVFPNHTLPTAANGFMNEFSIRSIEECHEYFDVWNEIEFYIRNWKYCEYYIGTEPVYHNEMACYIYNLIKNTECTKPKRINPETELKIRRSKWIHEKLLFNIIKDLYPNFTLFYHYRSKWLENLELDIYIENLKIGIEYQGIQHYKAFKYWGGVEGLEQRKINDERKKMLCKKNGVRLIYFDFTESITNTYVKNKITTITKGS